MRIHPVVLLMGVLLSGACAAETKRVLFLAGGNSHAWGQHKHLAGSALLRDALNESALAEAEVITEWPDAAALEGADALVIYADGWHAHPANDRLAELEVFMNAGKGLVALHWATGIQADDPQATEQGEDPRRMKWRALMGADFEAYHSISNFWTADFDGESDHPVMRGVKPFSLHEECYFHLRECGHDHGKTEPLWLVRPPRETIEPGLSPYRGNDKARASLAERAEPQYVAWTFQREAGGRAFGFTGGHFHWSWAHDEVRKMVLNGILWSAGGEVPAEGLESTTPGARRMLEGLPDKNPGWTEAALQHALDQAAEGEAVPWLEFTGKPLPEPPVSMFDGESLDGWQVRQGEEKWWSARDGVIRGGSLGENVPHNTFLASAGRYANFDLRLKIRLVKGEGFMNSGIQVRSIRVPDNHEMSGYQVDAGPGWWGKLYDESRRNKVIGEPLDPVALRVDDWDWNDFRILCEGPRIRSWINGVAALDYTEPDPSIPLEGLIGLQAHGGGRFVVEFKDLEIRELPPTPGAPAWEDAAVRSPERELASFSVAKGFEIELVASEREGVGKPVTMAWDPAGRMWTMTALEYPVDANENAARAETLFARGGKDRVLVFDEPWKPGPQVPRVFAEGLAIPLGLLPYRDGALVQHGREIRYYEDRNKDGGADGHQVVLTGFGIQDSHLFPHQFERSPGGWFYLAQGLFNYSKVARPDGSAFADGRKAIDFNQCKLARAKLDGSDFELLTAGPNNIWGLVTARDGREFLQEANDLGHPVSEFITGTHYPTGSAEKLRAYAPQLPPSTPGQPMGGTGLSGLALAEDAGSAFAAKWPDEKVFYLANPITNRIQIVTLKDGLYRKQEDFLVSSDEWFRPVSIHFGPDGCLYVADWCNKIISHNEVPRTHPDRDKTRGRIWRIKPAGEMVKRPVNLTALETFDLLAHLGAENARVARMAWQEIADRGDTAVVPRLERLARSGEPLARRLGALWALREMAATEAGLIAELAKSADSDLRREAVECLGDAAVSAGDFLKITTALAGEKDFQVRCELANALRRQPEITPEMAEAAARLAPAPAEDSGRASYESAFLRYLVRWALETHPEATEAMIGRSSDPVARHLGILALPPARGAAALLRELPALERPLSADEAALLGGQLSQPVVARAFGGMLEDPVTRARLLEALLQLDPAAASDPALREAVGGATVEMASDDPAQLPRVIDLARRFRLREVAPLLVERAATATDPAELSDLLRALNEIDAADADLSRRHLDHPDPAVAREAVAGFASAGGKDAVAELAERWPGLSGATRQFAFNGMLSNKSSAEAFAGAIARGDFTGFDGSVIERLSAALGAGHPALVEVIERIGGLLVPVIRLPGNPDGVVTAGITLEGSFTVETWIKLDPEIDNRDGLLGRRGGGFDINFYDGRLRLYDGGGDVVIADRPMEAGRWTHCAVTRDEAGRVSLYLDGEPAGISREAFNEPLRDLEIGRTNRAGGTAARLLEYRIWNEARPAERIAGDFRTRFPAGAEVPGLLVHLAPGSAGAEVEWTADFPELLTPEQAKTLERKFDRFRALARRPGEPAKGKILFEATCLICHPVRGEGVAIGPDLGGAGAMGLESLLRNILTPGARLESGYYRHDITLNGGAVVSGFLASENAEVIVIRPIGADERAIPREQVAAHTVSRRSLMPEGLIDGFSESQVADLFAYLMSLR